LWGYDLTWYLCGDSGIASKAVPLKIHLKNKKEKTVRVLFSPFYFLEKLD
jgi:hypothetical protein